MNTLNTLPVPQLTFMGELWAVNCEFEVWALSAIAICNIMNIMQ